MKGARVERTHGIDTILEIAPSLQYVDGMTEGPALRKRKFDMMTKRSLLKTFTRPKTNRATTNVLSPMVGWTNNFDALVVAVALGCDARSYEKQMR